MLANKREGEMAFAGVAVPGFEAGGIVVFNFRALARLEAALNVAIEQIGYQVLTSPRALRIAMQAALSARHGDIDGKTAGHVIEALQRGGGQPSAMLAECFLLGFPEQSGSEPTGKAGGAQSKPWDIDECRRIWIEIDCHESSFWTQTPRMFAQVVEATATRRRGEADLVIMGAWRTAYYQRVKKLPDLAKELSSKAGPKRATKARSWEKQAAAWGNFLDGKRKRGGRA